MSDCVRDEVRRAALALLVSRGRVLMGGWALDALLGGDRLYRRTAGDVDALSPDPDSDVAALLQALSESFPYCSFRVTRGSMFDQALPLLSLWCAPAHGQPRFDVADIFLVPHESCVPCVTLGGMRVVHPLVELGSMYAHLTVSTLPPEERAKRLLRLELLRGEVLPRQLPVPPPAPPPVAACWAVRWAARWEARGQCVLLPDCPGGGGVQVVVNHARLAEAARDAAGGSAGAHVDVLEMLLRHGAALNAWARIRASRIDNQMRMPFLRMPLPYTGWVRLVDAEGRTALSIFGIARSVPTLLGRASHAFALAHLCQMALCHRYTGDRRRAQLCWQALLDGALAPEGEGRAAAVHDKYTLAQTHAAPADHVTLGCSAAAGGCLGQRVVHSR
jgi:hypothetical protein